MQDVFIGSERLALGALTRGQLRWNYESIFPGVYAPKATITTLQTRTVGAWLWSGRHGVIAGGRRPHCTALRGSTPRRR